MSPLRKIQVPKTLGWSTFVRMDETLTVGFNAGSAWIVKFSYAEGGCQVTESSVLNLTRHVFFSFFFFFLKSVFKNQNFVYKTTKTKQAKMFLKNIIWKWDKGKLPHCLVKWSSSNILSWRVDPDTLVLTKLPLCMCGSRRSSRSGVDGIFGKLHKICFIFFYLIFYLIIFRHLQSLE